MPWLSILGFLSGAWKFLTNPLVLTGLAVAIIAAIFLFMSHQNDSLRHNVQNLQHENSQLVENNRNLTNQTRILHNDTQRQNTITVYRDRVITREVAVHDQLAHVPTTLQDRPFVDPNNLHAAQIIREQQLQSLQELQGG